MLNKSLIFGIWWDGQRESDARPGYTPASIDYRAQFRVGKLHIHWAVEE